jgi:hypothetical protein
MPDFSPQTPNKTTFGLVTVLGLFLLCVAVLMEARWNWVGIWPSILVNLGTTLSLAFALIVLERRFARAAKRESDSAVKETREEVSELGRSLGTRIDQLSEQMKGLTATEDAAIARGIARVQLNPSHNHITDMFETAFTHNALYGSIVTVPTSTSLTGPHLCFRWEPSAVQTAYNSIEHSGQLLPRAQNA